MIGGGFAGLSAAQRLLQIEPDLKVAILEAERIAEGLAGRSSGLMVDLPHHLISGGYSSQATEEDRVRTEHNRLAIRFVSEAATEYAFSSEAFGP